MLHAFGALLCIVPGGASLRLRGLVCIPSWRLVF
jgi:hypothetical protein